MNTRAHIHRLFLAGCLAATLSCGLHSVAAADTETEYNQKTVRYDDLNLSSQAATRVDPALYITVFFVCVLFLTKNIERMPFYETVNELLNLRVPSRARVAVSLRSE